jgi:hypothetical protein
MQVEGVRGEGQQEPEQEAKTGRHGYPDKTADARFPQAFLAT